MSRQYSRNIAGMINRYLTEDDWHFSFDEDMGFFRFNLTLKSKIKEIRYVISVAEDSYTVYAISPLSAETDDSAMMANMAEFICRANYGLRNGNFEMDFSDGEIRYKSFVDCEDARPSDEIISNSIRCPAAMFSRYGDGILAVIFNNTPAQRAVEKCEAD